MKFITNEKGFIVNRLLQDIKKADDVLLIAPYLSGKQVPGCIEKRKKSSKVKVLVSLNYPTKPQTIEALQREIKMKPTFPISNLS